MRESLKPRIEGPSGDAGQRMLDLVFRRFRQSGEWPEFDRIDRALYTKDVKSEDAVGQIPDGLLIGPDRNRWNHLPSPETRLELTLAGAIACSENLARPEVECAVLLTRLAAAVERSWSPTSERRDPFLQEGRALKLLRGSDSLRWPESVLEFIKREGGVMPKSFLDDYSAKTDRVELIRAGVLARAVALLSREPQFKGSGFGEEYGWELRFDREIRPFAQVATLGDYWRIRCDGLLLKNVAGMVAAVAPPPVHEAGELQEPDGSGVDSRWSVECALHETIVEAVADRYATGHFADAVQKAFQAVEYRVQNLIDSGEVGAKLMGNAFGGASPRLMVARAEGASQTSEQEGFRDLFRGAMAGLRNPRAHGPHYAEEEAEVLEMLAFASLLMRRLDLAEGTLGAEGSSVE
ncbi:TIGR02391 family protein [Streptomyces sp. NPDC046374]|uniref:TIGR02391 family protein n=1 Tax=Streptomyces sp. NPDC046374 TaxID=3154917 RepID=UPI0033E2CD89